MWSKMIAKQLGIFFLLMTVLFLSTSSFIASRCNLILLLTLAHNKQPVSQEKKGARAFPNKFERERNKFDSCKYAAYAAHVQNISSLLVERKKNWRDRRKTTRISDRFLIVSQRRRNGLNEVNPLILHVLHVQSSIFGVKYLTSSRYIYDSIDVVLWSCSRSILVVSNDICRRWSIFVIPNDFCSFEWHFSSIWMILIIFIDLALLVVPLTLAGFVPFSSLQRRVFKLVVFLKIQDGTGDHNRSEEPKGKHDLKPEAFRFTSKKPPNGGKSYFRRLFAFFSLSLGRFPCAHLSECLMT